MLHQEWNLKTLYYKIGQTNIVSLLAQVSIGKDRVATSAVGNKKHVVTPCNGRVSVCNDDNVLGTDDSNVHATL